MANFNTPPVYWRRWRSFWYLSTQVRGLHNGEGMGTVEPAPFLSENAHLLPIITGATILCFSFLGFDAVTTLCEETPDAAKVILRAIFLTALYGGVIFISVSFFIQLFFPSIQRLSARRRTAGDCAVRRRQAVPIDLSCGVTFINTLASGLRRTPKRVAPAVRDGA